MTARRPLALDLFCGGGGAALGLMQAGFDVIGIDSNPRHERVYPGRFLAGDILRPNDWLGRRFTVRDIDLVWASPPCQAFSAGRRRDDHPNLIPQTRRLLARIAGLHRRRPRIPTVIENVPRAPIRADIVLTGPTAGLFRILRRRHFELGNVPAPVLWPAPANEYACLPHERACITRCFSAPSHYYHRRAAGLSGYIPIVEAREAMGIMTPMTGAQVGEAVPPAYARIIAEYILSQRR